jgi:hypothetical protein
MKRFLCRSMKLPILLFACLPAFTTPVFGQAATLLSRACGPEVATFTIRRVPPVPQVQDPPASGARIVVFAEAVGGLQGCWLSNRIGIDGRWVGAACMQSYVSAEIDTGPRHLCADIQQKRGPQHTALYDFTAEPGKVYYFRVENIGPYFNVHLEPLNDAEGQLLLKIRKRSVVAAKKGQ